MPELYKVITVSEAQCDILEILLYIARELSSPQAALSLSRTLQRGIDSLSLMPKRIKTIEEQPWGEIGIRKIRVRNYYIYFWINEEDRIVNVIAVIFSEMDQEYQLQKRYL